MKRSLYLFLGSAILAMMFFAGCSPKAGAPETPAEEVKTITYLYPTASGNTPEPDNPVLREIEKRIGVKVDATMAAPGDYNTKLNTLIASRQLPDLFTASITDVPSFVNEGMLINLTELVAQYGKNLERELGPGYRSSPVNRNGLYMLSGAGNVVYENLAVRVDWLKKLGLEMPADLDSLYNVLYGFTYNDPDGNGKDDTIGTVMTMTQPSQWSMIFGAFGIAYNGSCLYLLEDGTVTTYMKSPDYLDAIAYFRKLYQAGVMDPEFATMPAMTAHEQLWTGRCGVYSFNSVGPTNNWYPGRYTFELPPDPAEVFGYTDIKGPKGYHGAPQVYRNVSGGFVVSSTAEYPDACVKFLDYQATPEGDELIYLGVEGLMFAWDDKAAGTYHRLGEFTDDAFHRVKGGYTYWRAIPVESTELRVMNKITREAQAFARANTVDWPYVYVPFDEAVEYGSSLQDITAEALARLIVTTGDVQAEYQAFVARWENEGGLAWEKGATAAYRSQQ